MAKVKRDTVLACIARLSIRKYRSTGDDQALADHQAARSELERRGITDQYGLLGWDDQCQ